MVNYKNSEIIFIVEESPEGWLRGPIIKSLDLYGSGYL